MKVFVLSFGTIELFEGILVIDSDLSFKTFEKEYSEILKHADKNLKKMLKSAFEKGEYEIDPEKEEILLNILKKLEAYDNPSLSFTSAYKPSVTESLPDEPSMPDLEEPDEVMEPEIFEEPEILEPDEIQKPEIVEPVIQPPPKPPAITKQEDDLKPLETPEIPPEEAPMTGVKIKTEGLESNFIIQQIEQAEFKLDHDGKIKKSKITGKLTLQNAGSQDRIWDINLELEKIKNTSIKEKSIHINEINPGDTWDQKYEVKKVQKSPINFKETIDTFISNSEEIHTLIPYQETVVEFTFSLENPASEDIMNLKMEKEIPKPFSDLRVVDEIPSKTELKFEDQTLIWNILTLKANQTLILKIRGKILPDNLKNIKTAPIKISFTKDADLYSDITFEDVSSISKNMYYIEKDEQEQQPNNWSCRFIFENKSEFPFLLESAEIFSGEISSSQKEVVLRAIDEVIQPSDEEWRSQDWYVVSEEVPTFGKAVKFKIIPSTTKSLTVNLEIEEIELPILWAEVKKTYSQSEVASYVESSLEVTTSISNQGDAEINELSIKDFIPENFIPPALNDLKFFLDGKPITKEKHKLEPILVRVPDSGDPAEPHQLHIQLRNLNENLGPIKKGSNLGLKYPIKAIKPPPGKEYNFPISVAANTVPAGPSLEINPDMVENSEIKVTHRRRKLTVGKSVFPGDAPGEYDILILFKNRGNIPIENAVITDLVPTNFKLLESNPDASTSEIDEKTLVEWKFDVIEAGKKLEISYKLKGTGDYKGSDAEIFYKV